MTEAGWQEFAIDTQGAHVEALEAYLFESGAVAITLLDNADEPLLEPGPGETPLWQNVKLVALFPIGLDLTEVIVAVPRALCSRLDDAPTYVPDQDWERAWMDSFHPMQMGPRLWICPSWTPPPKPDAVNVMLDPGLAFGTGTHPTTAMCLGQLDALIEPGMSVVDYGCGTGILAIAAIKLGASVAVGVDNDPQAITASNTNAARNDIEAGRFSVYLSDEFDATAWQGQVDVVVANILAGPLTLLAPKLKALLKPGGSLLLAGLLADQAQGLIESYMPELTLSAANDLDGWVLLKGEYAG